MAILRKVIFKKKSNLLPKRKFSRQFDNDNFSEFSIWVTETLSRMQIINIAKSFTFSS